MYSNILHLKLLLKYKARVVPHQVTVVATCSLNVWRRKVFILLGTVIAFKWRIWSFLPPPPVGPLQKPSLNNPHFQIKTFHYFILNDCFSLQKAPPVQTVYTRESELSSTIGTSEKSMNPQCDSLILVKHLSRMTVVEANRPLSSKSVVMVVAVGR